MIEFEKFELSNGLTVLVHQDNSTPIVAMNILYDVGARDEHEDKTGFAHLFEHLMFGGSKNIPSYDQPLQRVGGENNAFTSNDITNYYITIPKQNLETAFWLESDRMKELAFTDKSLEVQRNVVIEEFRQRYLNQPYGDVWLNLRPLAYQVHPYKWPTIGKEISHIEDAEMQDVKDFFYKHYRPNNAIMSIAGDVELEEIKKLSEKWFGDISSGEVLARDLPKEPKQVEKRTLTLHRDVPVNSIYKAYHMCSRRDEEYYSMDLMSDVLSRGRSSRLHQELVKRQRLFSELNAYVTGDFDEGLFVISGKLMQGVEMEAAEKAIEVEVEKLRSEFVTQEELVKVKNKVASIMKFAEMNVLDKAMNLAIYELISHANLINEELVHYEAVNEQEIKALANRYLIEENSSVLYYKSEQSRQDG